MRRTAAISADNSTALTVSVNAFSEVRASFKDRSVARRQRARFPAFQRGLLRGTHGAWAAPGAPSPCLQPRQAPGYAPAATGILQ